MDMNIFAIASKEKYRYPYKGSIGTEDLWDLSAAQLDTVFKALNSEKKTVSEASLLTTKNKEDETLDNKIDIVKFVFEEKLAEVEQRKQKVANAEKKRRLKEIIASKQDEALAGMSIDDLTKMLNDLE